MNQDTQSLTTLKRNSSDLMKRMKKARQPLVLTVRGKTRAVLLDPPSYQDVADYLDTLASIRRGLAQAKKGIGRSVADVFDGLERESWS